MIRPKRLFTMANPDAAGMIRVHVDRKHYEFMLLLPYVSHIVQFEMTMPHFFHVYIDPRYDFDDAWLDLYDQLEAECHRVELADIWNTAFSENDDEDAQS